MKYTLFLLLSIFLISCSQSELVYDSRIQEKEILTPEPRVNPKINGPLVYGARPGMKFLYRIPCQGERPIEFKIEDLPDGLNIDKESGIITGLAPRDKGRYSMLIHAKNQHGSVSRSFTIHIGEELALTPPTGWNSWGGHMVGVSDKVMRTAADLMVSSGLADVGFQYVCIDDCWMLPVLEKIQAQQKNPKDFENLDWDIILDGTRDEDGNILTNERFPDMKAMTDHIHSYGLKAGIYSSPGEITCQKYAGSAGHEQQDAKQYADWGFDLLKYDQCRMGTEYLKHAREKDPNYHYSEYWKPMADYLRAQDRDILYNLCQYGLEDPWIWAPSLGISSWRQGGDLNHNVDQYFEQALRLITELRNYHKPGQWNDPDFMYIHKIRDHRDKSAPSKEIALNTNQRYQYVTLWSIICAPFFFSCDINEIDEFTIKLLGNADVFNINQDELGHVAEIIHQDDNIVMLRKDLVDGSMAVAVFNRSKNKDAECTLDQSLAGIEGHFSVYDVWRQKDLGTRKENFMVKLSPDGVAYFILKAK